MFRSLVVLMLTVAVGLANAAPAFAQSPHGPVLRQLGVEPSSASTQQSCTNGSPVYWENPFIETVIAQVFPSRLFLPRLDLPVIGQCVSNGSVALASPGGNIQPAVASNGNLGLFLNQLSSTDLKYSLVDEIDPQLIQDAISREMPANPQFKLLGVVAVDPTTLGTTASISQKLDSPVKWSEWQRAETAKRILRMQEDPNEPVEIYFKTHSTAINVGTGAAVTSKPLVDWCWAMSPYPTYRIRLLRVYPVIKMRGVEYWAEFAHSDQTIGTCGPEIAVVRHVKITTVLLSVTESVLESARSQMEAESQVWPVTIFSIPEGTFEMTPSAAVIVQSTTGALTTIVMTIGGILYILALSS